MKMNPIMNPPLLVLAGGFGTRLQSVLGGLPKALAPVNGRPFLSLQIEHWIQQGVNSFIFLLHHNAELIIEYLRSEEDKLLKGCRVQYVVESKPMGTGGAVAYAVKQLEIEGDFLLTNADTWVGLGVTQIMKACSPAILVVKVDDVGRYGEVIFNDHKLVTEFLEKRSIRSVGWINAGISLMNRISFEDWDGQPFALETITYPQLVIKKALNAVTLDADFIDIGIPQDYAIFCRWVESGRIGKV